MRNEGLPSCPVVKNLPSSAGDIGSIPGQGTKIPQGAEQLGPLTATTEPTHSRGTTTKTLRAATRT